MKKLAFIFIFIFIFGGFGVETASAFKMSISPASREYIVNRGDEVEFEITFINQAVDGDFVVNVSDFVYSPSGAVRTVNPEDLADPSQSMTSWVSVDRAFFSKNGSKKAILIGIKVPDHANYGDHYARIQFKPTSVGGSSSVAISGGISTVLYVKVLGGSEEKLGKISSFEAKSSAGARNPVTFSFSFKNIGNVFFPVLAEIEVFESDQKYEGDPIKILKHTFSSFPNVFNQYKIPLGDLGDDVAPGKYLARLNVSEYMGGKKRKSFGSSEISFDYFLPASSIHLSPEVIEKKVIVSPPIVEIVKELFWYVMAFLVLLLVSIRLLFFSVASKKKK